MKRIKILGLLGAVCLVWGCGEDKNADMATTPTEEQTIRSSLSDDRLVTRDQLIGTWLGQYIHIDPHSRQRMEFTVSFVFNDTAFLYQKAETDSTNYHCPHVYAWGPWATDGLALWLQNHAFYTMDCFWYPISARNHPVWFDGNTLIILENEIAYPDSVVSFGYLDTFRLVRVK